MSLSGLVVGCVLLAAAGVLALRAWGGFSWRRGTEALRGRLASRRETPGVARFEPSSVAHLPAPVRRYLAAVLQPGQGIVSGVEMEHAGTFNMSETGEKWVPFTSNQRVVTRPPGFDWDARIAMAPGFPVFVHDAYVGGEGLLVARAWGVVTFANVSGTPDIAQGELMRYLAEVAWYPTVLLPGQGVEWEAVDDTTARATLTDGATTVSLVFAFGPDGLISTVRSEGRQRTLKSGTVSTPWQGRFWAYAPHDGMLVPTQGEVSWEVDGVAFPYWRGEVRRVRYEFEE